METPSRRRGRLRIGKGGILLILTTVGTLSLLALTALPYHLHGATASAYGEKTTDSLPLRRAILGGDLTLGDDDRQLTAQTASLLSSPSYLKNVDARGTLYVVQGLQEPVSESEARDVYRFVAERGGSALIAEDYNGDTRLGRAFGVSFTGAPILTTDGSDPTMVRASATVAGTRYANLLVRTPVPLSVFDNLPGNPVVEALVETGPGSIIDLNGDGALDSRSDAVGPFVIGYRFTYPNNGTALFLGSPSLLQAALWESGDNQAFLKALIPTLVGADVTDLRVLFDEGRHHQAADPVLEPLEVAVAATREGPLAAGLTLLAILVAAFLVYRVRGPEDWSHRYRGDRTVPMVRDPDGLRATLTRILDDQAPDGRTAKDLVQDAPTRAFLFDNHSPKPEELAIIAREVRRIVQ